MNKHQSFTKSLIMYHYLICCKLKFDLHRNNKLYALNIHIILNLYFRNFLNFILKFKFTIYMHTQKLHHTLLLTYILDFP